jgi:glucose-6-phosphate isomerase
VNKINNNKLVSQQDGSCLITDEQISAGLECLAPERARVRATVYGEQASALYNSVYASLNLSRDSELRAHIKKIVQDKKALRPTILIVVGIGGSNLGTLAVHQALYGQFYNQQNPDIKLYFADGVDTDYTQDLVLLAQQELERGNPVLVAIISKSGSTTETVVNTELFLYLLRAAYPETYVNYVVIITDHGSALWDYAGEHHMARIAIPAQVGGRFSVLSAVGLFPLAMLGVDIDALHAGATQALVCQKETCESENRERCAKNLCNKEREKVGESLCCEIENLAARRAVLLEQHYRVGRPIHDLFIFSADLAGLGLWYRQLMAESLGKDGLGITPTVSMGTVDLHSVVQLYLGGPDSRFTTFVAVEKNKSSLRIPNLESKQQNPTIDNASSLEQLASSLSSKAVSDINNAILQGVLAAYTKQNRPFVLLTIPEKNAYYIGMVMQLHMLEIIYTGFLLGINPFDQPQVELYKEETRKLLNKK